MPHPTPLPPLYEYLRRLSLTQAVLVITIASVASSMLICGTAVALFMPWATFNDWGWMAMLVPAFCSSAIGYVIMSLVRELDRTRQALANTASLDPLTGIANRRAFLAQGSTALSQARLLNKPTSVLMLDIDHFKRINDSFGHKAGDDVLVRLAAICADHLRGGDIVCRWGGEEFVILLPGTDHTGATAVAERLRQALPDATAEHFAFAVTASIGVATDTDKTLEQLIEQADGQLYRAKQSGRDRIMPDYVAV